MRAKEGLIYSLFWQFPIIFLNSVAMENRGHLCLHIHESGNPYTVVVWRYLLGFIKCQCNEAMKQGDEAATHRRYFFENIIA
jgi:hypothetical protein